MSVARTAAWAWSALLVTGLLGGCSAVLGDWSLGTGSGADGGENDATAEGGSDATQDGPATSESGSGGPHDGGTEATACTAGNPCSPSACVTGVSACDAGATVCIPGVPKANGATCDAGAVCDNGHCVACHNGQDCSEAGSCQAATIACSTGMPVCTSQGPAPNGESCGTNLYCDNGSCAPCTNGAACVPSANPCHNGSATCADGGIACIDQGTNANPGTACGNGMVCNGSGQCTACTSGASCNPSGNACKSGTTSCASGSSTCTNLTNVGPGTPCGTNQVCDGAGNCVACASMAACNPMNNVCVLGSTDCSSGAPVCNKTGNAMGGTTCGSNQVCDGNGNCGACMANQPCHPTTCSAGTTSCTTGSQQCTNVMTLSDGTSCGTGQICDNGTCSSGCYIGSTFYSPGALNPGNPCQSCQPSASTSAWTDLTNGAACGNGTCSTGSCVVTLSFSMTFYGAASGSVSTNPTSNVSCNGPCTTSAQFPIGSNVTLTTSVPGGNIFNWTGGCTGGSAVCALALNTNVTVGLVVSHNNYAFVTSTKSDANLGGLTGADQRCTSAAATAGLPLDGFQAFIVEAGMANITSRLTAAGARGWIRVDGQPFADQISELTGGAVRTPLWVTETGSFLYQATTWTGANFDGTPSGSDCSAWTTNVSTSNGSNGVNYELEGLWYGEGSYGCNTNYNYLYCFGTTLSNPMTYAKTPGRIAFLSKTNFDTSKGISGGPTGITTGSADVLCQTEATQAGLSGTYLALLATTGASAASRFSSSGLPWVRPDGIALASTAAVFMAGGPYLTSLIQHADGTYQNDSNYTHQYTRTGAFYYPDPNYPGNAIASPAGSLADTCNDWTTASTAYTGSIGWAPNGGAFFNYRGGTVGGTSFPAVQCGATSPIVCLQQ